MYTDECIYECILMNEYMNVNWWMNISMYTDEWINESILMNENMNV